MRRSFRLRPAMLILTAGVTFLFGVGGCLDTTIQRILVGLAI